MNYLHIFWIFLHCYLTEKKNSAKYQIGKIFNLRCDYGTGIRTNQSISAASS